MIVARDRIHIINTTNTITTSTTSTTQGFFSFNISPRLNHAILAVLELHFLVVELHQAKRSVD